MRLAEVEAAIRDALDRINRPDPAYTIDRRPRGDGTPHVEGEGPFFDLVVDDDGMERSRETVDGHELLFRLLCREMRLRAMAEERRTCTVTAPGWLGALRRLWPGALDGLIGSDDYSRGTWIDGHIRLMGHLRSDWGARVHTENDTMLRRYPLTRAEHENFRRLDLRAFGVK
ncbi:hypothetical protein [Loktanella sp. R86503]|uniref:hypothetical protein n=1 Tax=Loktanella sp. R86503 TaxID=3093847 RepID=UPI0036DC7791